MKASRHSEGEYKEVGTACAIIIGDERLGPERVNSPSLILLALQTLIIYQDDAEITLDAARDKAIPHVAQILQDYEKESEQIVAAIKALRPTLKREATSFNN